jgi:hypothetical protein
MAPTGFIRDDPGSIRDRRRQMAYIQDAGELATLRERRYKQREERAWRVPAAILCLAFVGFGLSFTARLAAEIGSDVKLDRQSAVLQRCLVENTNANLAAEGWWTLNRACQEVAETGGSESSRCVLRQRDAILAGDVRGVMAACGIERPRAVLAEVFSATP